VVHILADSEVMPFHIFNLPKYLGAENGSCALCVVQMSTRNYHNNQLQQYVV